MRYEPFTDERLQHMLQCGMLPHEFTLILEQARRANALVSWAEANIPEMDCHGGDECDHCVGRTLLAAYRGDPL